MILDNIISLGRGIRIDEGSLTDCSFLCHRGSDRADDGTELPAVRVSQQLRSRRSQRYFYHDPACVGLQAQLHQYYIKCTAGHHRVFRHRKALCAALFAVYPGLLRFSDGV